jgi:hypothetical protein
LKRVFANRRDWREYLSRIECGYTLQQTSRAQLRPTADHRPGGGFRASADAPGEAPEVTLAPRLEAMTAVFAETRRQ